jgi:hypothetical protein
MAAYRIFSRLNTFYGLTGQLLAGGYLKFYTEETTTPKDVYGDEALSVNNGATVDLDASGRPDVDVWGDGDYFIELYDADDVKQGDMDNVAIYGGGSLTIPALVSGQFLSNNGTVLDWESVRQVPDPTGQVGKILGTDGTAAIWQDPPAEPTPEYTISSTSIEIGDLLIQWGTGTAPAAASAKSSAVNISFTTAFTSAPYHAGVTISNAGGSTPAGDICTVAVTNLATNGMTVTVNVPDDDSSSSHKLASSTPFTFFVIGPKTT